MEAELTNRRPSLLSGVFRRHQRGRLLDWTRIVDGDWKCYCPYCSSLVVLIEEKLASSAERGWTATRRSATHHEDRPWAWLVVCQEDGSFQVTAARASDHKHQSIGPTTMDEDKLIGWLERAFQIHYAEAEHPAHLLPVWLREAA